MEFLIFLGAILLLVLNFLIAKQFYLIAEAKGYPEEKYLWWSFFCGVAGYLMVVALPDHSGPVHRVRVENLSEISVTPVPDTDELPDL